MKAETAKERERGRWGKEEGCRNPSENKAVKKSDFGGRGAEMQLSTKRALRCKLLTSGCILYDTALARLAEIWES